MKIMCDTQVLITAITNVQRAVSGKSTIPALEGALLRASGSSLFLAGYDLDIGITTTIEADVMVPGETVINAKQFADIARGLPNGIVTIETDEKLNVRISCGNTNYMLFGITPEDYPDIPSVDDGMGLSMPQSMLKGMIRQTLFSVAQIDAGRPVHTGILFEAEENCLSLIAVDGSRLAIRKEAIRLKETMKFVVPGKTLQEVLKLLQDTETPLFMAVGKRHAVMQIDGYAVITRLLDGEFLAYRKAIPQIVTSSVRVNTRELLDAAERVSKVINDRIKMPMVCTFSENNIRLYCSTSIGIGDVTVPCFMTGNEEEMGVNNRFFIEALKNAETDEVSIELGGPVSPIKIMPTDGDEFLFLILPVRMNKQS